jgi:glycosyltransferase involved in cell wall biosynthesis
LSLARGLDSSLYTQRLVCTQVIGGLPPWFREAGCPIDEVGLFDGIFDRRRYHSVLKIVREFRPHIIHGAVYEGVALAEVCGRVAKVPVIIGEETSDPVNRSWKGHLLYRGFAGLCHHMIGVSPAVTAYLQDKIKLPARKVTLINNGVAEKPRASYEEIAAVRDQLELRADAIVIGAVARLFDEQKRISDLIRAMPRIVADSPAVRLLVVGTGPDEQALRRLAAQLGVAGQVRFVGYQANTQPYYEVMDIFALASVYEGLPLVLLEAMFVCLPVVATRIRSISSVVNEGETGYLVDPDNPDALSEAILRLMNDPSARYTMGQAGRERALKHFSSQRYTKEVDALYKRLLSRRHVA